MHKGEIPPETLYLLILKAPPRGAELRGYKIPTGASKFPTRFYRSRKVHYTPLSSVC